MNAELVLQRMAEKVVAATRRTVFIRQEFRNEEQRDAARAGRCIRKAGENEVNDVVSRVVFAPGDENLLAEDAVGAVTIALRPGLQNPEIRTRMRLGQVHGAGPFTGNEFRQIDALEIIAAVGDDGFHRAHGQRRRQREGHGAGIPHFECSDIQHMRQVLAAELFRRGQAVPARFRPAAVKIGPTVRRRHLAVGELRALTVANIGERCDLFGGETASFLQDGIHEVFTEIAKHTL
ncbi:hypothetical protein D3C86_1011880 [compost metagenome]